MGLTSGPRGSALTGAVELIRHAIEIGVTFFDTADVYGPHTSEVVLGRAIEGRREQVILSSKFGVIPVGGDRVPPYRVDATPAYMRAAIEGTLRRLGVDYIDLYSLHRPDLSVPIEETIGAMAKLVDAGKVRYLGLSNASAGMIRRAASVHRLAAVQNEWSLWNRLIEGDVVPTCRELGIAIVPYCPLARGLLTGRITGINDLTHDDTRLVHPHFHTSALPAGVAAAEQLSAIALRHEATPSQVALAWLLHKGPDVVPIPGTRRKRFLLENVRAVHVHLAADEVSRLDSLRSAP